MRRRNHTDAAAYGLAGMLTFTGVMHFVVPNTFAQIVPPALGDQKAWVYASGVGELLGAVTVAYPRTRRWGARWCAALFVLVFPANVYMAVTGATGVPTWVSWARLPLQIPLVWWAVRIAKRPVDL